MKRKFVAILITLALAAGFAVAAYAKDYAVPIGEISVPFSVGDDWYVSTLGSIDPGFKKGNDLTTSYFNRFMYTFGYAVWLKNKSVDNEIILVISDAPEGQKDYALLSDAQLNAIADAQTAEIPAELSAVVSTVKYTVDSVVFLRTDATVTGVMNAVTYSTVVDGKLYEIRLNAVNDEISPKSIAQQDSMASQLGSALSSPQDYPTAPETTLPEGIEEEEVFDLDAMTTSPAGAGNVGESGAQTTDAAPGAPSSTAAQKPGETTSGTDAAVSGGAETSAIEAASQPSGDPSENVTLSEYRPDANGAKSRGSTVYWIAGAAVLAAAAAAIVVVLVKKKAA